MTKKIFSTVCGLAVIALTVVAATSSQAKAADTSQVLATYGGAISNALNDNQSSKVAKSLLYYAVTASGECESKGWGMAGCIYDDKKGTYTKTVTDTGPPGTAYYDWKTTQVKVQVEIDDPKTKAYLQNYFKCPPSEGCPGNSVFGNFDAFVMGNKFTAAEATEMVAWVYGENMAASYAENLASQGIKGTDSLANKLISGGKPTGLQTFYGVLDKVDNMGAMMEDQLVNGIKGTVKTEVKDLLAKAGIANMDQLDLMSTSQLSQLAKGALGVDMTALEKSAIGKLSDKIGFDVNNLSGATKDQLAALGVSDLAFKQFEVGGLNNYKNLYMYGLDGPEQMWNFDKNALFDTVGIDMEDLTSLATDELELELGVDDLAELDGLEGDDLLSAVDGDTEFAAIENIDPSAFDDYNMGEGIFAGGGSGGGSSGGGWSGGSNFVSGSGSGWKIM